MTRKFKLGRDFCTMHLTAKFHHPTFNRSEVIVLTNNLTNKQTLLKTSTSLRYATLVGNKWRRSVGEFEVPEQISTGFASWIHYCTDVPQQRTTKLCTMFGRLLHWYTILAQNRPLGGSNTDKAIIFI